jgi:hypothetical protein
MNFVDENIKNKEHLNELLYSTVEKSLDYRFILILDFRCF